MAKRYVLQLDQLPSESQSLIDTLLSSDRPEDCLSQTSTSQNGNPNEKSVCRGSFCADHNWRRQKLLSTIWPGKCIFSFSLLFFHSWTRICLLWIVFCFYGAKLRHPVGLLIYSLFRVKTLQMALLNYWWRAAIFAAIVLARMQIIDTCLLSPAYWIIHASSSCPFIDFFSSLPSDCQSDANDFYPDS